MTKGDYKMLNHKVDKVIQSVLLLTLCLCSKSFSQNTSVKNVQIFCELSVKVEGVCQAWTGFNDFVYAWDEELFGENKIIYAKKLAEKQFEMHVYPKQYMNNDENKQVLTDAGCSLEFKDIFFDKNKMMMPRNWFSEKGYTLPSYSENIHKAALNYITPDEIDVIRGFVPECEAQLNDRCKGALNLHEPRASVPSSNNKDDLPKERIWSIQCKYIPNV